MKATLSSLSILFYFAFNNNIVKKPVKLKSSKGPVRFVHCQPQELE